MDELLTELVAAASTCSTDAERWNVIKRGWLGYREQGAGHFDWDYDSRTLMDSLLGTTE